ncbi:MAG: hypothetical protein ABEK01_04780 [Candidatus Nanohaloarchaea archaeon]
MNEEYSGVSTRDFLKLVGGFGAGTIGLRDLAILGADLSRGKYLNGKPSSAQDPEAFENAVEGELPVRYFQLYRGEKEHEYDEEAVFDEMDSALDELEEIRTDQEWYEFDLDEYKNFDGVETPALSMHDSENLHEFMEEFHEAFSEEQAEEGVNLLISDYPTGNAAGLALPEDRGFETGYALLKNHEEIDYAAVHETAHVLGLTHTAMGGMTNTFIGRIAGALEPGYFGPESKEKWEKMKEERFQEGP